MHIGIFCSANNTIDPDFFALTRQLGEWMGRNRHTLVYGGTDLGLMDCVAHAVADSGGHVVGVLPARLLENEHANPVDHERVLCHTLAERKQLMTSRSDVLVALPGGIGTLDEVLTVAGEGTLAYHDKKVIMYSMKGFWDGLEAFFHHLAQQGFIRGDLGQRILFAHHFEELTEMVARCGAEYKKG